MMAAKAAVLAGAPYRPPHPAAPGIHVLTPTIAQVAELIDWTPFFWAWDLKGTYPKILQDARQGEQARSVFADARTLLAELEAREAAASDGTRGADGQQGAERGTLEIRTIAGLFPANGAGDDIEIYADDSRSQVAERLHFLRMQRPRNPGEPHYCLSDFVAPRGRGVPDWIGAFAVGVFGADELAAVERARDDDYAEILVKVVADRLAEAGAEWLHREVRRRLWGYAPEESLPAAELAQEKYRGIRPAPGYPACPDHTEKGTLWRLLEVEQRLGMSLTESFAMLPAAAVSGWYFSHPASTYFGIGAIGEDQLADYARRKGWTMDEARRWLAPLLR